jgi:hypothetical protein
MPNFSVTERSQILGQGHRRGAVIAEWRIDYNQVRSHSSLGCIPPAKFASYIASALAMQLNHQPAALIGTNGHRSCSFVLQLRFFATVACVGAPILSPQC